MKHQPSKRLSQHFLTDKNIARNIVKTLPKSEDSIIIEIGSGTGVLTEFLIATGLPVIAIELDLLLVKDICNIYGMSKNLQVIQGDFLSIDLKEIISDYSSKNVVIIGNIPYHITSPIVFKILENADIITTAVFMLQKEVAERIGAIPGSKSYGILSIFCQAKAGVEYLFTVPAHLFYPRPKVASGVIRMNFNSPPKFKVSNPDLFQNIVRKTFAQRRKMLRNTLSDLYSKAILSQLKFDLTRRPDSLTVDEFRVLTNQIHKILVNKNYGLNVK
jgi:16S rRNA (adenine1518-N6/adenine1519-N6)-dimethyltransferase